MQVGNLIGSAANGVRRYRLDRLPSGKGGGDVYVLPTSGDGICQRVTVTRKPWWKGGGHQYQAVDARGQTLDIRAWDRQVTVVDKAGTTRLDLDTLDFTVSADLVAQTRPIPHGVRRVAYCPVVQRLAADGNMRVRTNYRVDEDRIEYSTVRECPPNASVITRKDESYDDTVISPDGSLKTTSYTCHKFQEPSAVGEPPSRIDQSGDLYITRDGKEEAYHLFVPPHAMNAPAT